jgi:hypothetical protein
VGELAMVQAALSKSRGGGSKAHAPTHAGLGHSGRPGDRYEGEGSY